MNKAEWILVLVVVALLVGPFVTIKAIASFRQRRGAPPPGNKYDDGDESSGF
jgi:hypothetical protein